ncbi:unnamed protein product [Rangifer tarandus platyrhynchus]|uniref:Uncharacterized protein n=1 Tax=Rangifer tarandus platyrhynchus TaxID=3082113 RepID=A0AC59ZEX9_RANTA
MCLVAQLCLPLCDPIDCSLPGSSALGDSPGKNPGVSYHALLQGIFPTQGSNPSLLHCKQILLPSEPLGKPILLVRSTLFRGCGDYVRFEYWELWSLEDILEPAYHTFLPC